MFRDVQLQQNSYSKLLETYLGNGNRRGESTLTKVGDAIPRLLHSALSDLVGSNCPNATIRVKKQRVALSHRR